VSDDSLEPRRAARLVQAARAAQALSDTLWEELHDELGDPRRGRVAELSEQLGEVVAIVASFASADDGRAREAESEVPAASMEPDMRLAARARMANEVSTGRQGRAQAPAPPWETAATGEASSPAVLVDELASPPAPTEPAVPGASTAPESYVQRAPQIEIRDERGGEDGGPAAWIGSIGRRLERHRHDGSPFAVLLFEIVGIERLRQAEPPEELARLTNQVEEALARGLRPADSLTRESAGRYWLLAPQTDAAGGQLLAERILRAVRSSAGHRGAPLEVAVGIAVCPDDGRQASALAAHADVELYAARAAGRSSVDR
jgi:GGDEF domain-containing protein